MTISSDQEQRAIRRVSERLRRKFSERSPAEVDGVVDQVARRFGQARIREYVPILVERVSRDELDHRTMAT
ncbi:MAG TPA: hypothetical protein VGX23_11055 [Actinocrinis sp.]|nr:hypothetical protein [Actinocrinis sp.]